MRLLVLAYAALLISSCATRPDDEKLCHADITGKLLNPETAEFHDFRYIDKPVAKQQILEWAMASNLQRRQSAGLVLPEDPAWGKNVASFIDQQLDDDEKNGAKFAMLRVRADTSIGNKATGYYVCRVWSDHCLCETGA